MRRTSRFSASIRIARRLVAASGASATTAVAAVLMPFKVPSPDDLRYIAQSERANFVLPQNLGSCLAFMVGVYTPVVRNGGTVQCDHLARRELDAGDSRPVATRRMPDSTAVPADFAVAVVGAARVAWVLAHEDRSARCPLEHLGDAAQNRMPHNVVRGCFRYTRNVPV